MDGATRQYLKAQIDIRQREKFGLAIPAHAEPEVEFAKPQGKVRRFMSALLSFSVLRSAGL